MTVKLSQGGALSLSSLLSCSSFGEFTNNFCMEVVGRIMTSCIWYTSWLPTSETGYHELLFSDTLHLWLSSLISISFWYWNITPFWYQQSLVLAILYRFKFFSLTFFFPAQWNMFVSLQRKAWYYNHTETGNKQLRPYRRRLLALQSTVSNTCQIVCTVPLKRTVEFDQESNLPNTMWLIITYSPTTWIT